MQFEKHSVKVKNKMGEVILKAENSLNLFIFAEYTHSNFNWSTEETARWHNLYGHLNFKSINDLEKAVNGLKMKEIPININCTTCMKSIICSHTFPSSNHQRSRNLSDVVHSEVCGPMNRPSLSGTLLFSSMITPDEYLFIL